MDNMKKAMITTRKSVKSSDAHFLDMEMCLANSNFVERRGEPLEFLEERKLLREELLQ